jgi:hypothetical protein
MSGDTNHGNDLVQQGRREGFAIAALALSLVSFVHLLGAEKALLAIVLAVAAVRGGAGLARRRGRIALAIAGVYLVTCIVSVVMLRDKFGELIGLLSELG